MDKYESLTPESMQVIRQCGTEPPFTGKYDQHQAQGTYCCRQCGLALFRSSHKFLSSCGWPSFDDECEHAIKQMRDPDGVREEIRCVRCDAHLGHVFLGEGATAKNKRHCVNSLAVDFVDSITVVDTEEAIVAGGCFWGVETLFQRLKGVVATEVGYIGGDISHPSYEAVCTGNTGHLEAVRIVYDKKIRNYETIIRYFFEIHDPTQVNGQGPDLGAQYLSAIFYFNAAQKAVALEKIQELNTKGYPVTTSVKPMQIFWPAEAYHQKYYEKTGKTPYCHVYKKRF